MARILRGDKVTWTKISQIRTLSTKRLGKHIGRVTSHEIKRIIQGLNEIID